VISSPLVFDVHSLFCLALLCCLCLTFILWQLSYCSSVFCRPITMIISLCTRGLKLILRRGPHCKISLSQWATLYHYDWSTGRISAITCCLQTSGGHLRGESWAANTDFAGHMWPENRKFENPVLQFLLAGPGADVPGAKVR